MATPTIGLNANLYIGTTTTFGDATSIGYVLNATPSFEADEVDVTPITSTGHREYIPGPRSATVAFEVAFDNSDTQHHLLLTQWAAGGTNYYHLEVPGGALDTNGGDEWIVKAFITNISPGVDPSDKHNANVTLRCTGAPTTPTMA